MCSKGEEDEMEDQGGGLQWGNVHDTMPTNVNAPMAPFITLLGLKEFYGLNSCQTAIYPGLWNPKHDQPFFGHSLKPKS